ncbi:MAG: uracil-DNA glycosylase [Gemmatimonadota bacterium]
MSDRPPPSESARLLRQRLEMGIDDLVLDSMSTEDALAALRAAARNAPVESAHTPADAPRTTATAPASSPPPRVERPEILETPAPPKASERRALPVLPDDYEGVRQIALGCTACGLADGRTQVVFSDGPPDARLMVVGEAPGANEDRTGVPFVGAAGQFLDLLLATVGLSREDSVYIANVLKCRPPGNRDPQPDEIEACSPLLRKQIELVKPDALLAVGSFSGRLLAGQEKSSLGRLRGTVHSYHGVPLVVTYHPAALLRNGNWTRSVWEDLQLLRDVIDRA